MCGIVGIVDWTESTGVETVIKEMIASQNHRGPDSNGYFLESQLGLAMGASRLSILDLDDRANMPMKSPSGDDVLVYNGEVYNHPELREVLRQRFPFRTSSDTEVLLYKLIDSGIQGIPELDGMFAFAWYDRRNARLVLARDRVGIKPLYYLANDRRFLFASEIKSIWEVGGDDVSLSESGFWETATQGYVYGTGTPFSNIRMLEPGCCLTIDLRRKQLDTIRFHDLINDISVERHEAFSGRSVAEVKSRLRDRLEKAVARHCIADAPMGVVCSGGVDSSLLAVLSAKYNADIELYHADVQGGASELKYAQMVAKQTKRPLNVVSVGRDNFVDNWVEAIYHGDIPSYHPNDIPMFLVCQLAKNDGKKVLISGEGADELFGGYQVNLQLRDRMRYRKLLKRLPEAFRKLMNNLLLSSISWQDEQLFRKLGVLGQLSSERMTNLLKWQTVRLGNSERFRKLLQIEERTALLPEEEKDASLYLYERMFSHLATLLMRNDKMGMMASIETRVPYLDNMLISDWMSMPLKFKIAGNKNDDLKYILKSIASDVLPSSMIYRPKVGFSIPLSSYLKKDRRIFEDGFLCDRLQFSTSMLHQFIGGMSDYYKWASIEIWGRLFIWRQSVAQVKSVMIGSQGESGMNGH